MRTNMRTNTDILKACPLFRGIDEADIGAVLGCLGARPQGYKKGQTILAEGDRASHLGIVLDGAVQIERGDYLGNRSIVGRAMPAELFAESFACAGAASMPVDVIAAQDAQVLLIDAARITQTCTNACDFHNQMIFNLLQIVAEKNLQFNQKLEVSSMRSTREKLMTYLLQQAKQAGSSSFTVPYDRQELADYLGVERSGLSAEISKLRKEGVLESNRKHFTLL